MKRRKFLELFIGGSVGLYAIHFYLENKETFPQLTIKDVSKLGYSIGCAYAISGGLLFEEIMKKEYKDAGFDTVLLNRHFLNRIEYFFVQDFILKKGLSNDFIS
jgi:hypothetical protein